MTPKGKRMKLSKTTRRAAFVLGVAALLPFGSAVHAQQQYVMKFATQTLNDVHTEYMQEYKNALEKATNGRIKVELYPAAQLGAAPRQVEGLRLGTIQAAIGPAELFVGADPRLQAVALPALFKDDAHARRTILIPSVRKAIADVVESRNLLLVGITAFGSQSLVFKTPVTKLSDFSGKRVRVLASEGERISISALGGSGVPMALPEVLSALQQGTIDGVNSALPVFVAFKYYDTAANLLDTHLWEIVSIALVSKRWYDQLPPDLQKAVLETGSKIEPEVAKWSMDRAAKDSAAWASHGGIVSTLSADEQAEAEKKVEAAIQPLLQKNPQINEFYGKLKAGAAAAAK
jgi:TRAP-type C4-dicarboxylate transport system substrate-binding protein